MSRKLTLNSLRIASIVCVLCTTGCFGFLIYKVALVQILNPKEYPSITLSLKDEKTTILFSGSPNDCADETNKNCVANPKNPSLWNSVRNFEHKDFYNLLKQNARNGIWIGFELPTDNFEAYLKNEMNTVLFQNFEGDLSVWVNGVQKELTAYRRKGLNFGLKQLPSIRFDQQLLFKKQPIRIAVHLKNLTIIEPGEIATLDDFGTSGIGSIWVTTEKNANEARSTMIAMSRSFMGTFVFVILSALFALLENSLFFRYFPNQENYPKLNDKDA